MVNGHRKSDSSIVPEKLSNKGASEATEAMEGRGLTKGNLLEQNALRTQGRESVPSALERVREARQEKEERFTALFHHVYDVNWLREAYYGLKRQALPGVDGETWQHYGRDLERNLKDLSERLKRGAYRAKPVQRAYIPKADGKGRPIGIPTLEDKIVQRATAGVLNAIYEKDFLGFSYGFRPGRSAHLAVDALAVGIMRRKVAERRSAGRRQANTGGRRNSAGWKYKPASVEHLSSLRIRLVGPLVASTEGKRRDDRRAFR